MSKTFWQKKEDKMNKTEERVWAIAQLLNKMEALVEDRFLAGQCYEQSKLEELRIFWGERQTALDKEIVEIRKKLMYMK